MSLEGLQRIQPTLVGGPVAHGRPQGQHRSPEHRPRLESSKNLLAPGRAKIDVAPPFCFTKCPHKVPMREGWKIATLRLDDQLLSNDTELDSRSFRDAHLLGNCGGNAKSKAVAPFQDRLRRHRQRLEGLYSHSIYPSIVPLFPLLNAHDRSTDDKSWLMDRAFRALDRIPAFAGMTVSVRAVPVEEKRNPPQRQHHHEERRVRRNLQVEIDGRVNQDRGHSHQAREGHAAHQRVAPPPLREQRRP